jgi:imidazolonepropionase-like amidohydrolase
MRPVEAALLCLLAARAASAADGLVIVGATVVDGSGVVPDAIVVVSKGRIESMGPRSHVRLPKGLPIQDGRGSYVVAGAPWTAESVARLQAKIRAGAGARESLLTALRDRGASLAAGAPADFVVVDKDPLADPSNLRGTVRALRDGRDLSAEERRNAER